MLLFWQLSVPLCMSDCGLVCCKQFDSKHAIEIFDLLDIASLLNQMIRTMGITGNFECRVSLLLGTAAVGSHWW
jgi:hypothetical protein